MQKLINSFKYAFTGIFQSLKTEKNMKIHFFFHFLVIVMGFLFKLSYYEWLICLLCCAMVISGELFNTAIEVTVDLAMPKEDAKAKLAKDVSAGAVLVLAIFSFGIGLLIFLPKIWNWWL